MTSTRDSTPALTMKSTLISSDPLRKRCKRRQYRSMAAIVSYGSASGARVVANWMREVVNVSKVITFPLSIRSFSMAYRKSLRICTFSTASLV
jgi:outer membrane translocation and assembly module TamA